MHRPRSAVLFEAFVVVGLVALPAFLRALYGFLAPETMTEHGRHANLGFLSTIVNQLLLLALTWHVARLNGESLRDFSEPISKRDAFRAIGLAVAGYVSQWAILSTLHAAAPEFTAASNRPEGLAPFRVPLSVGYLALMVVNPHFEEIIVRGFLQTRLRQAGLGAPACATASALVQGAYHIYQGLPFALAATAGFAFWAAYYEKTRRLWPIVGAHLIMDLMAAFFYSRGA